MAGVTRARDGAVGILTLSDPSSLNAMTPDLLGGLATAIGEITGEGSVRALVLTEKFIDLGRRNPLDAITAGRRSRRCAEPFRGPGAGE